MAQLIAGQLIEHERFGVGKVIRIEGTGENTKALIHFTNAGEKQLLLKFARFRVMKVFSALYPKFRGIVKKLGKTGRSILVFVGIYACSTADFVI